MPSHLGEAFLEWIDRGGDTVEVGGDKKPLRWLLGQLWDCTDALPADDCTELELLPGSTYAVAVRKVARLLLPD